MKICNKCGINKFAAEFSWHKRNKGLNSVCKSCAAEKSRAWYRQHTRRGWGTTNAAKRRALDRDKLIALKKTLQCAKCGFADGRALCFHHRDPVQKRFRISGVIGNYGWATILEEIAKCDVLCSNCHTILHVEERINGGT